MPTLVVRGNPAENIKNSHGIHARARAGHYQSSSTLKLLGERTVGPSLGAVVAVAGIFGKLGQTHAKPSYMKSAASSQLKVEAQQSVTGAALV